MFKSQNEQGNAILDEAEEEEEEEKAVTIEYFATHINIVYEIRKKK